MRVRFLSVAEAELEEAVGYYEEKEKGLGLHFLSEVRNAITRIVAYPDAWCSLSKNTRRCRTKVFPFGIIYQVRCDEILILAVAALQREPYYWKNRLPGE